MVLSNIKNTNAHSSVIIPRYPFTCMYGCVWSLVILVEDNNYSNAIEICCTITPWKWCFIMSNQYPLSIANVHQGSIHLIYDNPTLTGDDPIRGLRERVYIVCTSTLLPAEMWGFTSMGYLWVFSWSCPFKHRIPGTKKNKKMKKTKIIIALLALIQNNFEIY